MSVVEWLERLELVCKLRDIADVPSMIPMRLTDGAFAVYLQLSESERKTPSKVRKALLATFPVDPYVAYEQFVNQQLQKGALIFTWLNCGVCRRCLAGCQTRPWDGLPEDVHGVVLVFALGNV